MSKFFVLNVKNIIWLVKNSFEKKLFLYILQGAALIIGIILGATVNITPFIYRYYATNAQNYYSLVMYANSSCTSVLFERIASNLGYFIIYFVLGLAGALFAVSLLITAYRGYVLGLVAGIFASQFGLTGILIFVFLVMIQNLITSAALCFAIILGSELKKICCKDFIANYAVICAALYIVSLVGALIEALILGLLLRPLNFYF